MEIREILEASFLESKPIILFSETGGKRLQKILL